MFVSVFELFEMLSVVCFVNFFSSNLARLLTAATHFEQKACVWVMARARPCVYESPMHSNLSLPFVVTPLSNPIDSVECRRTLALALAVGFCMMVVCC